MTRRKVMRILSVLLIIAQTWDLIQRLRDRD